MTSPLLILVAAALSTLACTAAPEIPQTPALRDLPTRSADRRLERHLQRPQRQHLPVLASAKRRAPALRLRPRMVPIGPTSLGHSQHQTPTSSGGTAGVNRAALPAPLASHSKDGRLIKNEEDSRHRRRPRRGPTVPGLTAGGALDFRPPIEAIRAAPAEGAAGEEADTAVLSSIAGSGVEDAKQKLVEEIAAFVKWRESDPPRERSSARDPISRLLAPYGVDYSPADGMRHRIRRPRAALFRRPVCLWHRE